MQTCKEVFPFATTDIYNTSPLPSRHSLGSLPLSWLAVEAGLHCLVFPSWSTSHSKKLVLILYPLAFLATWPCRPQEDGDCICIQEGKEVIALPAPSAGRRLRLKTLLSSQISSVWSQPHTDKVLPVTVESFKRPVLDTVLTLPPMC